MGFDERRRVVIVGVQFFTGHREPTTAAIIIERFPYFQVEVVEVAAVLLRFLLGVEAGQFGLLVHLLTGLYVDGLQVLVGGENCLTIPELMPDHHRFVRVIQVNGTDHARRHGIYS